jgi:hypothetical protein
MNLFKKRNMFAVCACATGLFMMSFDVKNETYGESSEFTESISLNQNPEKVAITGWVVRTAGYAFQAVSHMTPEMEAASYINFGVKSDNQPIDNIEESKEIKLDKLD